MVKIAGGISAGVPPSWVNAVCDSSWQDAFWEGAFGILTSSSDRGHSLFFALLQLQYFLCCHSGKYCPKPQQDEVEQLNNQLYTNYIQYTVLQQKYICKNML